MSGDRARPIGTLAIGIVVGALLTLLAVQLTVGLSGSEGNGTQPEDQQRELVVFMVSGASDDQLDLIRSTLEQNNQFFEPPTYCDARCSMEDAAIRLAGQPGVLELLNEGNIPTSWRVLVRESVDEALIEPLIDALGEGPGVRDVVVGQPR